jgi:hypothetical protein
MAQKTNEAATEGLIPWERQQQLSRELGGYVAQLGSMLAAMQRRLDALEKENAMRVTINHQQAKGLQARIRQRAEALCEKHGMDPRICAAALRSSIRKAVLREWGITDFHDLPLGAYALAAAGIDGWTNLKEIRRIREKGEK